MGKTCMCFKENTSLYESLSALIPESQDFLLDGKLQNLSSFYPTSDIDNLALSSQAKPSMSLFQSMQIRPSNIFKFGSSFPGCWGYLPNLIKLVTLLLFF